MKPITRNGTPEHRGTRADSVRWLLAGLMTLLAILRITPAFNLQRNPAPMQETNGSTGIVTTGVSPTEPAAGPSHSSANTSPSPYRTSAPPPDVSPQLRSEVTTLLSALVGSLEGQDPLQPRHAQFLAGWVFNLMLDAAHQNAVDLGTEPNPSQAIAQVLQILDSSR